MIEVQSEAAQVEFRRPIDFAESAVHFRSQRTCGPQTASQGATTCTHWCCWLSLRQEAKWSLDRRGRRLIFAAESIRLVGSLSSCRLALAGRIKSRGETNSCRSNSRTTAAAASMTSNAEDRAPPLLSEKLGVDEPPPTHNDIECEQTRKEKISEWLRSSLIGDDNEDGDDADTGAPNGNNGEDSGEDEASGDGNTKLPAIKVLGHRGALYDAPENTIVSFETALEQGAVGVELDVFKLKCGKLAVFHGDGSDALPGGLKSYCDGREGSIVNLTAEEAQELPLKGAAHFCPEDKLEEAQIEMLEDVLEHAKENGHELKIELKGPGTEEPVVELVEQMDMVDQVTFSSFHHDRIEKIRKMRPQVDEEGKHVYKTGALFTEPPEDFVEKAKEVDATEVHLRYDTCTKDRVDAIHDAGLDSMAWCRGPTTMRKDMEKFGDVKEEDEHVYSLVLQSGVQAMCVNRPDKLSSLVEAVVDEGFDDDNDNDDDEEKQLKKQENNEDI